MLQYSDFLKVCYFTTKKSYLRKIANLLNYLLNTSNIYCTLFVSNNIGAVKKKDEDKNFDQEKPRGKGNNSH